MENQKSQEEMVKEAVEEAKKAAKAAEETVEEATEEVKAEDVVEDTEETVEESKEESAGRKFFGKKNKKDKKDEKIEELSDKLLRQMAEFDNFRKRTEKEKSAMYEIGAKDIVEKRFETVKKGGYNIDDVDRFLRDVSVEYLGIQKENEELEEKLKILAEKIKEYRNDEDALRDALLIAKKQAISIENDAKAEAERILKEAVK